MALYLLPRFNPFRLVHIYLNGRRGCASRQFVRYCVTFICARRSSSPRAFISHPSCSASNLLLLKLLEFVRCDVLVSLTLAPGIHSTFETARLSVI